MTKEQAADRLQIIHEELQWKTNEPGKTLAELDSLWEIYNKEAELLLRVINANHPAPPYPRRRPV